MNQLEVQYWDKIAHSCINVDKNCILQANINKIIKEVEMLMRINFLNCSILEIGIGVGVIVGVLRSIYGNKINYHATDMSKTFVDFCVKNYDIPVVQTDAKDLPYPDQSFDYIFAFDSLEHVHPNDRDKAYSEIDRVMKKDACIILNIPLTPSVHDAQFDHPFTYMDFVELLRSTRSMMESYHVYTIYYKSGAGPTQCAWAIGERHI